MLSPAHRLPLACLLLACLFSTVAFAAPAPAGKPATVRILNWEEFLSPRVLKGIKNRHGITVEQITFSTTEERDRKLEEYEGRIDLVVADTAWISELKRRGQVQKLETARIPALKHVMSRWQSDNEYAVPYLWGHTGIAWRTDKVAQPISSYSQLLALAKQQPRKVSLLDDTHEALRAALYAGGTAPYAMTTVAAVNSAAKLLATHLPNLRIVGSELGADSPWVTGEIIAGQAYNGDVAYLRDTYKLPIAFAIPSPGCMIWQEHFLLLKNAPDKEAAYRFLDAISDPQNAARNANDVRYATSNVLAVEHLPTAFRNDPIIRPTFEGLKDCYFYQSFDAQTQAAIDAVELGN